MIKSLISRYTTPMLLALVACLAVFAWLQDARLQDKTTALATEQQRNQALHANISAINHNADRQASALASLANTTGAIRSSISNRDHTIRKLERENDTYRNWAATPLPDAAIRLRQRPALTGADAYQQHLSNADSLHPVTERPPAERRPDARDRSSRSGLGDLRRESRRVYQVPGRGPGAQPPATAETKRETAG